MVPRNVSPSWSSRWASAIGSPADSPWRIAVVCRRAGPYRHGVSSAAGRGKKGAAMLEGAACGPSRKLLTLAAAGAGHRRCPRPPPTHHPRSPPPKNPATLTPDTWPPAAAPATPTRLVPTVTGPQAFPICPAAAAGANPTQRYGCPLTPAAGNPAPPHSLPTLCPPSAFCLLPSAFCLPTSHLRAAQPPPDHVPCCQQIQQITRRSQSFS